MVEPFMCLTRAEISLWRPLTIGRACGSFETAYEGQRKFDLIRWGVLGDALRAAQTYIE